MIVTCVDVGSTFTKALAVSDGRVVAAASHRTTSETDVLFGLDAAVAATGVKPDELLVCSSAGGGLRLAVIGYERLVTAEAGHRVGLSSGAKVVHVAAGNLDPASLRALREANPDVVLLAGGTDGGDTGNITHNANQLAKARWRIPVVLAGNADVRSTLEGLLAGAGVPVTSAANVLPAIGVLDPGPARAAIRSVFLRHVIGGKKLSRGTRFARLVRGATPDLVLTGVTLLGQQVEGDVLVVDVGGATTDVYSILKNDDRVEVAGVLAASRTVEGDLGMRWSAPGVVTAALAERLGVGGAALAERLDIGGAALAERLDTRGGGVRAEAVGGGEVAAAMVGEAGLDGLAAIATELAQHPGLPQHTADDQIARLAVAVALRRHARGEAITPGAPRRSGRDLRAVRLVVGSGGVFRHRPKDRALDILFAGLRDDAGGYPLPRDPQVVIDSDYVLAAAGLLADVYPDQAAVLVRALTS